MRRNVSAVAIIRPRGSLRAASKPQATTRKVGAEAADRGQRKALHGEEVALVAGAGGQGDVEVEALARAFAARREAAGVEGEVVLLVERHGEDVGTGQEDRLGAVAVVDVQSSTATRSVSRAASAASTPMAALARRQKPMGCAGSAWWPGGRHRA
jgi:hypothetical protein